MSLFFLLGLATASGSAVFASEPLKAVQDATGGVVLWDGARKVLEIEAGTALEGWKDLPTASREKPARGKGERLLLDGGGEVEITVDASSKDGKLTVECAMKTSVSLMMESARISINSDINEWLNVPYSIGGIKGKVPETFSGTVHLDSARTDSIWIGPAPALGGISFKVISAKPARMLVQDSRKWWHSLELRVSADRDTPWLWRPGETVRLGLTLSASRPIELLKDGGITVKAGRDWVPYVPAYDIEAGSALDWSSQRPLQGPAGSKGWLRASKANPGTMEFESEPGKPVRIYGNNLGTSAVHPDRATAQRLADRIARQGYSGIRIHHYESPPWVKDAGILEWDSADSLTFNPERMDRFDYLVAELEKRGVYISTDLYVSRMVRASEVFGAGDEDTLEYKFKRLVHVSRKAEENWKEYARRFLTHVNPYTGKAYREDPALFSIALINEGNLPNQIREALEDPREKPLWEAAFRAWKARTGRKGDWGSPEFTRFLWETHVSTQRRLIAFLRNELKVKAMITDLNGWTDQWGAQPVRTDYDYVDNHFYWDHPDFIERPWQLPSRGGSGGGSAVYALSGLDKQPLSRLLDRPFALTEANYCPPNDYRAEAGLLMGAIGALQDWSSVWRFAYSDAFTPRPMGFFDTPTDPVAAASEYAAVALFGRGDAAAARHGVAVSSRAAEYWKRAHEWMSSPVADLRAVVRVGTLVEGGGKTPPDLLKLALAEIPGSRATVAKVLRELRAKGFLPKDNSTDPSKGVWESETGEITFDTGAGVFSAVTPRTVGIVAPAGAGRELGPVRIEVGGSQAAVWISSLDGLPIGESKRMLLVHLTDVKQTGMRFRETMMKTMEEWGGLPLLARTGSARIRLNSGGARNLKVWRLKPSGKRAGRVRTKFDRKGSFLEFEAAIKSGGWGRPSPTFHYEIAEK